MRLLHSVSSTAFYLTLILATVNAITLSDFQPISGFPASCANAYNSPLSSCSASDFQNGSQCSTSCIAYLEALTKMLLQQCAGTKTVPNTLIFLFLNNQGTSTLCSDVSGDSVAGSTDLGGSGYATSAAVGQEVKTSSITQTTTVAVATEPCSSSLSSSPISTSTTLAIATVSASVATSSTPNAAATTTKLEIAKTTVKPAISTTHSSAAMTTKVEIAKTTINPVDGATLSNSHSSASPSSPSSTSSSLTSTAGNGNPNGGGTILDVGSTSCSSQSVKISTWVITFIFGSAGLLSLC